MLIFRKMNSISSRLVPIRIRKKRRFVRRFLFDHGNGRVIHQFSLAPSPKNATFEPPDPLLPPKNATFRLPEPSRCRPKMQPFSRRILFCRPKTLPLDCQNSLAAPKNAIFKLQVPMRPPKNVTFRLPVSLSLHRPKTLPFNCRILFQRLIMQPLSRQSHLSAAQKCNLSGCQNPLAAPKNATFQAAGPLCSPKKLPLDLANPYINRLKTLPFSCWILLCRPKTLP